MSWANQVLINLGISLLAGNLLLRLGEGAFLREPLLESAALLDDLSLCLLIKRIRHFPDNILRGVD